MLSNRDIGFVSAGQEAEIKVDTFPFTRYGLLRGHVLSVSQDAITRDKPREESTDPIQETRQFFKRAEGPGTRLFSPCLARPHADADRGQACEPFAGYGGHGRDQDGIPQDHHLLIVAARQVQTGSSPRKMIGGKSETSSDVEMARVPLGRFHGDLRDLARFWLQLAAQPSITI